MVRTMAEAEALAAMNMGHVCRICAAMEEKRHGLAIWSLLKAGGGGRGWDIPLRYSALLMLRLPLFMA